MKIIEPSKIEGEIEDLLETAKEQVVIISPYNELTDWKKMINKVKKAQKNGVKITWYSRKDAKEKYPGEIWRIFNIRPILIENLHAKLYLNEDYAIITSMNLCKTSNDISIDIGLKTTNKEEFREVYRFYNGYIKNASDLNKLSDAQDEKQHDQFKKTSVQGKNISNLLYINEIYRHLVKNFGELLIEKKHHEGYNDDGQIKSITFKLPKSIVEIAPFKRSLRIKIYININYSSFNDAIHKRNLLSCKELEISDEEKYLKYYYKSNFIIQEWDQMRVNFFLNELDILLEIASQK